MAKKKKSATKKGNKKKVKFNKGTPYEMEYVWIEPAKTWFTKLSGCLNGAIEKLKKLILD